MGIPQALALGYTAKDILGYLMRVAPEVSSKVNTAISSGYSYDQIVKFLEKHAEKETPKKNRYNPNLGNNPLIEASESVYTPVPEPVKNVAKTALGAAGAYALNRALPNIAGKFISALSPALQGQENSTQSEAEAPPEAPPQTEPTLEKQNAPPPDFNAEEILNKMDILKFVQSIAHKPPEVIATVLKQHILKPPQIQWLKSQNIELSDLVSSYLASHNKQPVESAKEMAPPTPEMNESTLPLPGKEQTPQNIQTPSEIPKAVEDLQPVESAKEMAPPTPEMNESTFPLPGKEQIPQNIQTPSEIPKEEKKQVILPSGEVGSVISERNGIAKVDVDGVIKHRAVDDLQPSPIDEKKIGDIYEDLLASIPEEHRSAALEWAGYDEVHNEFAYKPHIGGMYIYKNIPENFQHKIKNALFEAKTTGQTRFGVWEKGGASRGAGMAQLIQDLKKSLRDNPTPHTPQSHNKEYERKYVTVYDFLEVPKNIVKKRDQELAQQKKNG